MSPFLNKKRDSWDVATVGSGRNISTENTEAPYSICPKGWKLPTAYNTDKADWQNTSDFYVLAHQYGLDSTTSTYEPDSDFYNDVGPGTVPNFLLTGYYFDGNNFYYGGSYGFYWSSTSDSNRSYAWYFGFNSDHVDSAYNYPGRYRRYGFPVRCFLY